MNTARQASVFVALITGLFLCMSTASAANKPGCVMALEARPTGAERDTSPRVVRKACPVAVAFTRKAADPRLPDRSRA
jgi:hypothetical protein